MPSISCHTPLGLPRSGIKVEHPAASVSCRLGHLQICAVFNDKEVGAGGDRSSML